MLRATEGKPATGLPDLSVVIVTRNVRDMILPCLRALAEASEGLEVEAIVVDNGSRDGTVRALREAYPGITVIANGRSAALPAANGQGLALARGRHVMFLNPDALVGRGSLAACVSELDAHAELEMVGLMVRTEVARAVVEATDEVDAAVVLSPRTRPPVGASR